MGNVPILTAIEFGDLEIVKLLIQLKVPINDTNCVSGSVVTS